MITVKVTSEKTLETSDDIAAFLLERYAESMASAAFQPGDAVSIVSRAGMVPNMGVGDVAVVLFSEVAPSPFTHVRLLHENGSVLSIQVQTANLSKRDAS